MIKGTYTLITMEEQLFSDKKDLAKELNVRFNNVANDKGQSKRTFPYKNNSRFDHFKFLYPVLKT